MYQKKQADFSSISVLSAGGIVKWGFVEMRRNDTQTTASVSLWLAHRDKDTKITVEIVIVHEITVIFQ